MAKDDYTELPLVRHSSLIRFLEEKYDDIEEQWYQSHKVSEMLILEMARLARVHDIKFIVAGIFSDPYTQAMLDFAKQNGIPSVDISVDLGVSTNTNLPYDGHPSAIANKQYADKIEVFLRKELLAIAK